MTRINLPEPTHLTDKHLGGEFYEIIRIPTLVLNTTKMSKVKFQKRWGNLPQTFRLNKGHVLFFYNKMKFLEDRFMKIHNELMFRGVDIDIIKFARNFEKFEIAYEATKEYQIDWKPSPEDIYLSMARLTRRSQIDSVLEELFEGEDEYI